MVHIFQGDLFYRRFPDAFLLTDSEGNYLSTHVLS